MKLTLKTRFSGRQTFLERRPNCLGAILSAPISEKQKWSTSMQGELISIAPEYRMPTSIELILVLTRTERVCGITRVLRLQIFEVHLQGARYLTGQYCKAPI